jgi:hypothetical protein
MTYTTGTALQSTQSVTAEISATEPVTAGNRKGSPLLRAIEPEHIWNRSDDPFIYMKLDMLFNRVFGVVDPSDIEATLQDYIQWMKDIPQREIEAQKQEALKSLESLPELVREALLRDLMKAQQTTVEPAPIVPTATAASKAKTTAKKTID